MAEAYEVFLVCAEVFRRSLNTTNQARCLEKIVRRKTFCFFLQVALQCFTNDFGFGSALQLGTNTKPLAETARNAHCESIGGHPPTSFVLTAQQRRQTASRMKTRPAGEPMRMR